MAKTKPVVHGQTGEHLGYVINCPGCSEHHLFGSGLNGGPKWEFNGDVERPTFTPSMKATSGHYMSGHKEGAPCWCTFNKEHPDAPMSFTCYICHSNVIDGKITFHNDCTHKLVGQTVDLPCVED